MKTTFLGPDFQLPAGRNARSIKEKLMRSSLSDIGALMNDIDKLDVNGVMELNELASKAEVGTVMLATMATRPGIHEFSYDQTISLLTHVRELEDSEALSGHEVEQVASTLIRGYSAKQGLNLLICLDDNFSKGSKFYSSELIDNALVAHLQKTKARKLNWANVLHICDRLPKTSLMGTLKALTKIFLDNHQYAEIKELFSQHSDRDRLNTVRLNAFKEVLGEDQLLRMCQGKLMAGDGIESVGVIERAFGEKAIFSEGFVKKIKAGLEGEAGKVEAPDYWKHLNKYDNIDLFEKWPETAKLMIGFYDVTPRDYKPNPELGIVDFAAKHNLHLLLAEKAIDELHASMISTSAEHKDQVSHFNRSEILSYAAANRKGLLKLMGLYNACITICNKIGLVALKTVIPDISATVISDIIDMNGKLTNPREIMRHYPQAKGLLLEQALGL